MFHNVYSVKALHPHFGVPSLACLLGVDGVPLKPVGSLSTTPPFPSSHLGCSLVRNTGFTC